MSYYKPSFSQTAAMTRGRGYSSRGSYRGSSTRGNSWGGHRGYGRGGGGGGNRFEPSFSSSFESRSKYGGNSEHRYPGSRGHGHDDFSRKSYRLDNSYQSSRDGGHRSPDRKRPRTEAPSSRHDSYGGGYGSSRYDSSYSERRSFSSDRHPAPFTRRDEFRRPSGPPRGGYRGRISSRGSRGLKLRERPPPRRRLVDTSYVVRKRVIPTRPTDYARRLKISKMRSAIAARKMRSSDKDDSDDEKKENDEEIQEDEEIKKEEDAEINDESSPNKNASEKEAGSDKEEKPELSEETGQRKTFIKLNCPHCGIKAVTFRKYDIHLQSRGHMMSMRKVAIKQKSILAQMRLAQRNAQNELEKTSDDLAPRTNFCPLCKLNYKQRKAVHQSSEAHKNMKKFLMPFCKICSITFKSPMIYESHCCSIEHLKRKQRVENGENSDEFDEEHTLENFTTIDSVGVDGDASEEEEAKDVKEPVNIGIEQIRKVEAYYCDLCRMYVGRESEDMMPTILARHCKLRTHMQRYIRYKEDKDLEKRAEKLQRKETAEKEGKDKSGNDTSTEDVAAVKTEDAEKEGKDTATQSKGADDEEARDDKLWADVDKDLDDILAKESGNKSSDEDEDVNGERYDRFRYSEKNGDDKKETDGTKPVANDAEVTETAEEK